MCVLCVSLCGVCVCVCCRFEEKELETEEREKRENRFGKPLVMQSCLDSNLTIIKHLLTNNKSKVP